MGDKAKEAAIHRRKQKFNKEISIAIEESKDLTNSLISLQGKVSNVEDIDEEDRNRLTGFRRDIQWDIQGVRRMESKFMKGAYENGR